MQKFWMVFYSFTKDEWWFGGKKKGIEISKQHGTIKFGIEYLIYAEQGENNLTGFILAFIIFIMTRIMNIY